MISSVGWVPRNVLKSKPVRANVTKQDLERLQQRLEVTMHQPDGFTEAESEADVMEIDEERTSAIRFAENTARHFVGTLGQRDRREVDPELEAAMNELNFDTYDSDDDITNTSFLNRIVDVFALPEEADDSLSDDDNDDDESEGSSIYFEDDDLVFLATKAEDTLSSLEVWLYEEADDHQEGNLLVHHDIPLANCPLCCAYLDVQPESNERRNLVAIGGIECGIEIYDLDILDPITPVFTLEDRHEKKKTTLTLSVNELQRNIIASGHDDKRVRVWDLSKGEMNRELKLHKSSVQCIQWNPNEASILISGGHDKKCVMSDSRSSDETVLEWKLGSDNECVTWCLDSYTCFLASDESGKVTKFDTRKGSRSEGLFCLAAHKDSTTVISVCPICPQLFMSGSEDGKIKIWEMTETAPRMIGKMDLGIGEILAGGFCKHFGHLVVGAGDGGNLKVWDVRASSKIGEILSGSIYIPNIYKSDTCS